MFRFPPRLPKTLLGLLLASSLTGCMAGGDGPQNENTTQLIRGSIPLSQYSAEVVGVRVLAGNEQVSTARTDANGNFSIEVPVGTNYSFEIVTKSGTHAVLTGPLNGTTPMHFDVCAPGEDFDLGDIDPLDFEEIDGDETPWSDTEDECEVPPWICEDGTEDCFDNPLECDDPAADPTFCWDEPLPCDDANSDPEFCWGDGGGGDPWCDDPSNPDGNCDEPPPPPPWCDDPADPNCGEPPPPCDDPSDPDSCWVEPLPCEHPEADPNNCFFDECGDGMDPDNCFPLPCDFPEADPNNCFDLPLPCDEPNADPDNCFVDEPSCEDPTDPNCDCEDEPPFPCDSPDGDPDNCWDEPLPCENPEADPEFCLDGCEWGDPSCFGDDDLPDVSCEDGYDEPSCWPEPDICIVSPEGDFSECDDNIGGAPETPFPDFGCEEAP